MMITAIDLTQSNESNGVEADTHNTIWEATHKARWDAKFRDLAAYKRRHGNASPPLKGTGTLGKWVSSMRELYKCHQQGKTPPCGRIAITGKQIRKLEGIGFQWSLRKRTEWTDMYTQMLQYKAQHGQCNVPQKWTHNKALGRWVGKQREMKNNGTLYKSREAALNQAGFCWYG